MADALHCNCWRSALAEHWHKHWETRRVADADVDANADTETDAYADASADAGPGSDSLLCSSRRWEPLGASGLICLRFVAAFCCDCFFFCCGRFLQNIRLTGYVFVSV